MWKKHGVWCQCMLVLPVIMSLACILSWQTLTLQEDVYWSFLLLVSTIIQFCAAEHGDFGVTVDVWQRLQRHRLFVMSCIIATWTMASWPVHQHALAIPVYCTISYFASKRYALVLGIGTASAFLIGGPWALMLSHGLCHHYSDHFFSKLINTSLADIAIKKAYGLRALGIGLESVVLWCLRCWHRFPYTLRWTPLCIGIVVCAGSVLWVSVYIKDTRVSRNAIIKRRGHDIAASLTAASKCPVCQSCLSALDMESSFGS